MPGRAARLFWEGRLAALLVFMSFTYGPLSSPPFSNPPIDLPRLLVADTNAAKPIFQDEEINLATLAQQLQFQSSMFYSGAAGRNLPSSPVSYLRVAALLLDSLAANKGRLAGIQQMLDIKIDASKAAVALQAQAKVLRETDDNSGAFMIIEQCNDYFSFSDRFWKQVQRQSGV
jgi:hypothetical protein